MKHPPAVHPEKDWRAVELPFLIASGRTLASGIEDDSRLRLRLFLRDSDQHIVGKVWFGDGADGPPKHAHGGASAYILDEAMGAAGWANLFPVVAAELKFEYFQMVPMFQDHFIEAWVESSGEKRITVKAKLQLADGRDAVTASGQFHILGRKRFDALLQQCPPEIIVKQTQLLKASAYKWAPDAG